MSRFTTMTDAALPADLVPASELAHVSARAPGWQPGLAPPHHIDMQLLDGPFKRLRGRWEFHAIDESACRVTLTLEFEPAVRLLSGAFAIGFQGLADRMVDDFVRAADRGDA